MLKSSARSIIRLRGVRHNNLKNFDLDLPLHQLIVITGLSGSGKSSLAFDTLFAEGQRRYIETFSPYARQFFDRMDKPQVDSIEGIPPAIAIEQRNSVRTTRSTVGTMTEICDYMKMLWPHIAQLHCRQCGQLVRKDSPQQIWEMVKGRALEPDATSEVLVTFDVPLSDKLSLAESLAIVAKQGYQRLLVKGRMVRLDEALSVFGRKPLFGLTVIQDRLKPSNINRARFVEACEQAYHFGKGNLTLRELPRAPKDNDKVAADVSRRTRSPGSLAPTDVGGYASSEFVNDHPLTAKVPPVTHQFSNRLHCARCDIAYRDPSPALFSFNHPVGACPACKGFGRAISIDYNLALPDRSKTLAQGVVKPWQTGKGSESQADLLRMCRHFEVPINVPFRELPKRWQDFVIEGEPDYGKDEEHEWPRAWYGIKGYFRWLESKSYKMHVRVLLSRYRAYTPCPDCHGQRFQPETLLYRVAADVRACCTNSGAGVPPVIPGVSPSNNHSNRPVPKGGTPVALVLGDLSNTPGRSLTSNSDLSGPSSTARHETWTLADFYQLPIRDALQFIDALSEKHQSKTHDPLALVLNEVRSRLGYLNEVGLGYLTLDRPTRSLSGGETERVNLTTCLGTRLVNTLFVLDEPSVGLHPRDTARLVRILQRLRDTGNTVVVVEHEASVMRAADQIVDLGPGHGATGGQVMFQGTYTQILESRHSLTGQYLSGRKQIAPPERRPVRLSQPQRQSLSYEPGYAAVNSFVLNDAPSQMLDTMPICPALTITNATRHNLKNLSLEIPLGRFVCITGVSGSGKTTLAREVLLPALAAKLQLGIPDTKASDRLNTDNSAEQANDSALVAPTCRAEARRRREPGEGGLRIDPEGSVPCVVPILHSALVEGWNHLGRVILVDQSILGKTPRSNPGVYIGAFDDIREFFAQSEEAKKRGLSASAFSFNSSQGQCERCRGAGFEKIEMQFLSDVFIRCPDCQGRRYRAHILEVRISPKSKAQPPSSEALRRSGSPKSGIHALVAPKSDEGGPRSCRAEVGRRRATPPLHRRPPRSHDRRSHHLSLRLPRFPPGAASRREFETPGRGRARISEAGSTHQYFVGRGKPAPEVGEKPRRGHCRRRRKETHFKPYAVQPPKRFQGPPILNRL